MLKGIRKKALLLLILLQPSSDDTKYDKVLKQVQDFEIALQAMDFLLDDRSEEGIKLLQREQSNHAAKDAKQPAAIFLLALGVMQFIEATLGFETDVMNKAHKTLSHAEEESLAHAKVNAKILLATSHIYPPGTEFQVTYAELTLLNALVMLLHENNGMMEQAKALFKLRKAYQILDATYRKIVELEKVFNRNLAKFSKQPLSTCVSLADLPGYSIPALESSTSLSEDAKLMRNMEKVYQMRKARIEGTSVGRPHVNLFQSTLLVLALSALLGLSGLLALSALPFMDRQSYRALPSPANTAFRTEEDGVPKSAFDSLGEELKPREDAQCPAIKREASYNSMRKFNTNLKVEVALAEDYKFSDTTSGVSGVSAPSVISSSSSVTSFSSAHESLPSSWVPSAPTPVASSLDHLHVSTIDEFIHLGVQLCFGILQVVLLLIPPAIGRVLSIVGFKGDRETGLRMLWRTAITARNIHGELALLCLLVFYDGPVQFVDTGFRLPNETDSASELQLAGRSSVTDEELVIISKNPNAYTPQLLAKARSLFPHNALWLLQEGRQLAAQNNIEAAIELMQGFSDSGAHVEMEQVEALLTFDRAMLYAFVHDYENAARDFARMLAISTWSLSVYLFLAGACYLEKWRELQLEGCTDEEELERCAKQATHYLQLAPTYIPGHGVNAKKKGGIGGTGKQMPFDKFVLRKTKHIEERHRRWPNLRYIECVGTSLFHELVYFWNGYNRMPVKDLKLLHRLLEFSVGPNARFPEPSDEAMIRNLFQSLALRQSGQAAEGLKILDDDVIGKFVEDPSGAFKVTRMTYLPYLYPTAVYERAMFVWILKAEKDTKGAITEGLGWLKKAETVSDIGDYEMSNRTSMRIKAASERLEQLRDE